MSLRYLLAAKTISKKRKKKTYVRQGGGRVEGEEDSHLQTNSLYISIEQECRCLPLIFTTTHPFLAGTRTWENARRMLALETGHVQ